MRLAWRVDAEGIELAASHGALLGSSRVALAAPETPLSAEALLRWAASELEALGPADVEAWLAHMRDDICGNPCAQRALETALRGLSPA